MEVIWYEVHDTNLIDDETGEANGVQVGVQVYGSEVMPPGIGKVCYQVLLGFGMKR